MSELKSESVQVNIIIEWGLHTEIRSGISQQTFCSPWTYSLQNLVTDSKRTHRQARALVCIFFFIDEKKWCSKETKWTMKGIRKSIKRVSHIQSTDHFVSIHVHSANNLDPVQSIFSRAVSHIAISRKTSVSQRSIQCRKSTGKMPSKCSQSTKKVWEKCSPSAVNVRGKRKRAKIVWTICISRKKDFDLQFLHYFTATSWP